MQNTLMNDLTIRPRALVEAGEGSVVVHTEMAATPERVFRALTSQEVVDWWVRPGVFNTTEWAGDVRVGGSWRAAGLFRGEPYVAEGEFLDVDLPRKLVHTWRGVGTAGTPTTVAYALEAIGRGTRIMLRHSGFTSREACANFGVGWETSFERLAEILAAERNSAS